MAPYSALPFLLVTTLLVSPLVMADKSFDFYFLILQWPGSYCSQRAVCCKPSTGLPPKDFLIRGFETWDIITGEPVTTCNTTPFNVDEVADLSSGLQQYWSSIKCPTNNGVAFWKNAWRSFGVCSNQTASDYFAKALHLRARVDVLPALAKKGVVPRSTGLYRVDEIADAIEEGIGVPPLIRCSQSRSTPGRFLLYEVFVCVDRDGKTLVECPVSPYFWCPDLVQFPPFDYAVLSDDAAAAPALDGNPITWMPVSTE